MAETSLTNPIIDTRLLALQCLSKHVVAEKLVAQRYIDQKTALDPKFRANSLDNLCRYYDVCLEKRAEHHGAIIDCELLAAVYACLVKDKLKLAQQREKAASTVLPEVGLFQVKPQESDISPPTLTLHNS